MSHEHEPIDLIFAACGHPIRRKIISILAASGQSSVTDLAAPFDVTLMAISKHVRVLTEAGVIKVEKQGRTHWCSLNPETVKQARDWLDYHHALAVGLEPQYDLELNG